MRTFRAPNAKVQPNDCLTRLRKCGNPVFAGRHCRNASLKCAPRTFVETLLLLHADTRASGTNALKHIISLDHRLTNCLLSCPIRRLIGRKKNMPIENSQNIYMALPSKRLMNNSHCQGIPIPYIKAHDDGRYVDDRTCSPPISLNQISNCEKGRH